MSLRILIIGVFVSLSGSAWAGSCLKSSDVNAVLRDFRIVTTDASGRIEGCRPHTAGYKLLEGLIFIKNLGSLPSGGTFNRDIVGSSAYYYLKNEVNRVVIDDSPDCQHTSQVWPSEVAQRILRVCSRTLPADPLVMAEVLVHEARHMKGSGYSHRLCEQGLLKNHQSCDESFEDGGAYAASVEFLIKVSRSKAPLAVRQKARELALTEVSQRFNQSPLDLRQGALLQDDRNQYYFFDGENLENIGLNIPSTFIPVERQGRVVFFEHPDAKVSTYNFSSRLEPAFADTLTERYGQVPAQERLKMIDVVKGPDYGCFLYQREIECIGNNGMFVKKSLGNHVALQFIYNKTFSAHMKVQRLHIVTATGHLVVLPAFFSEFERTSADEWMVTTKPAEFIASQAWQGNNELLLSREGQLRLYNGQTQSLEAVRFDGPKRFRRIISPFAWSKQLLF